MVRTVKVAVAAAALIVCGWLIHASVMHYYGPWRVDLRERASARILGKDNNGGSLQILGALREAQYFKDTDWFTAIRGSRGYFTIQTTEPPCGLMRFAVDLRGKGVCLSCTDPGDVSRFPTGCPLSSKELREQWFRTQWTLHDSCGLFCIYSYKPPSPPKPEEPVRDLSEGLPATSAVRLPPENDRNFVGVWLLQAAPSCTRTIEEVSGKYFITPRCLDIPGANGTHGWPLERLSQTEFRVATNVTYQIGRDGVLVAYVNSQVAFQAKPFWQLWPEKASNSSMQPTGNKPPAADAGR